MTAGPAKAIPASASEWGLAGLRGADKLATALQAQLDDALLFKRIATVVADIDVGKVDDWQWRGPSPEFEAVAAEIGAPHLFERAQRLAAKLA